MNRVKDIPWLNTLKRRLKAVRRTLPSVYYVVSCLCVFTAVLALLTAFYRPCAVQGDSMVPTLQSGDRLLLSCGNTEPQYGDIIAVRREGKTPLIKRVIAVEGDTLRIDEFSGEVYLNGKLLEEPYIKSSTPQKELLGEVTVPAGMLFVMGDNRVVSHDSRYNDIGFVAVEDMIGTAVFRFYPFSRIGGV